ncbi:MAG: hypothetical protein H6719_03990 [Sandaracinaceae bacterium]|nr:hypothetical protein [Sandaracinaceae bacterium]
MRWSSLLCLLLAAGCGHIEYGRSERQVVVVAPTAVSSVPMTARSVPAPLPAPARDPNVVYVPWDPGAQPVPPPRVAAPANGVIHCGGADRVRVYDRIVDGHGGPAVVATGACVVEVDEAILRGEPAVVVQDQARVVMTESRIFGDIQASGGGAFSTDGCRHDSGRVVRY